MTSLEDLLPSLQGVIPASIATCARDGTPNISYLSQVHYVDPRHVAFCCRLFHKTRRNLEENPRATIMVVDPVSMHSHRVLVRFARSETQGPLFDRLSAQAEAVTSHAGMNETFWLRSADVYEVLRLEPIDGDLVEDPPPDGAQARQHDALRLRSLRAISQSLARAPNLDGLLSSLLTGLDYQLGFAHCASARSAAP